MRGAELHAVGDRERDRDQDRHRDPGGFVELMPVNEPPVDAKEPHPALPAVGPDGAPPPKPHQSLAMGIMYVRTRARTFMRSATAVLLCATFYFYVREGALGEDHRHTVAVSKESPSWQQLIEHTRVLVRVSLELRDVSNRTRIGSHDDPYLKVTLQRINEAGVWDEMEHVGPWRLSLADDVRLWQEAEERRPGKSRIGLVDAHRHEFDLGKDRSGYARLYFTTDMPSAFAVVVQAQEMSAAGRYRRAIAGVQVLGVFTTIALELIPRLLAVGGGSLVLLGVMGLLGERIELHTVIGWVDAETVALLFGMMLLVGYLSQTGFFEWAALQAYVRSRGRPLPCAALLLLTTAGLSAVLDNVTTILLMTPITVQLCEVLNLPAKQVVIATILVSNIGGAATVIGDPPNVMISAQLSDRGISFNMFLSHVAPGAFLALCGAAVFLCWALKDHWQVPGTPPVRSAGSAGPAVAMPCVPDTADGDGDSGNAGTHSVGIERTGCGVSDPLMNDPAFDAKVAGLAGRYTIRDLALLRRAAPVMAGVLVLFCVGPFLGLEVELAWIPLWGSALLAALHPQGLEEALHRVEWATLLFFGCLSIFMKGIEWLGLVRMIGESISDTIADVPSESRLQVSLTIILLSAAVLSAFVDNVPFTAAMIPIIKQLADDENTQLPLEPLVTALALGTCLGGNGTIVAASANVVAAGVMDALGLPITFGAFARLGVPVCGITVALALLYLLVRYH